MSNLEVVFLCRRWQGTPKPQDGEMSELRFYAPDEIDLSEISPPIRRIAAKRIDRSVRRGQALNLL